MSVTSLKVGGKDYVLIPKRRYDQLTRGEQDRIDAETARKGRELYESGKMKTVSLAQARRKWGV